LLTNAAVPSADAGHLHKRGSRWAYVVVDIGRDPATGKRKQCTRGGFATKAAAEEALGDFMSELRAGTAVAPSSVTLEGYLTDWLQTVKPQLRQITWASYVVAVDRITWGLGSTKLQALTAIEVERFYASSSTNPYHRMRPGSDIWR